jgi:hypothetical protein
MSGFIEWGALAQVVVAGLLVGAGIPALFALGLRLLSVPVVGAEGGTDPVAARPGLARRIGGLTCFAVVVAAVVAGVVFLVSGGH